MKTPKPCPYPTFASWRPACQVEVSPLHYVPTLEQRLNLMQYEVEELPLIGPLHIMEVGEENFYFQLADLSYGYCKAF